MASGPSTGRQSERGTRAAHIGQSALQRAAKDARRPREKLRGRGVLCGTRHRALGHGGSSLSSGRVGLGSGPCSRCQSPEPLCSTGQRKAPRVAPSCPPPPPFATLELRPPGPDPRVLLPEPAKQPRHL